MLTAAGITGAGAEKGGGVGSDDDDELFVDLNRLPCLFFHKFFSTVFSILQTR